MPTNGFQPLWQIIVVALIWLSRLVGITSAAGQIRVVIACCWLLLALGLWLLDRLLRDMTVGPNGRLVALVGVVAFLGGPSSTLATEASLVLVAAIAALSAVRRLSQDADPTPQRMIGAGALIGVLMLARLDAVFLAVLLVAAAALLGPPQISRVRLRQTTVVGVSAALVVAPYLIWNQARFGHVMPIAGAIKVDMSQFAFRWAAVGIGAWLLLGVAAAAGVIAFVGRPPSPTRSWWLVVSAGAVLSSAFYFCWSAGPRTDSEWYHVPHLLAAALVVGVAVDRLEASGHRSVRVVLAVGTIGIVLAAVRLDVSSNTDPSFRRQTNGVARFGTQLHSIVGPHAVMAVMDRPGLLAATSDRAVVAFDGLTGDYAYERSFRDLGAACTFAHLGVRYIVVVPGSGEIHVRHDPAALDIDVGSPLYRTGAGQVRVLLRDLLLTDPASGLKLFRYRAECR